MDCCFRPKAKGRSSRRGTRRTTARSILPATAASLSVIQLVCVCGFFVVPKEWSGKGMLAAITDRIHLGLDLRGGTHLILQVQVNDAVNVDSDNAMARLKEDFRTHKINY